MSEQFVSFGPDLGVRGGRVAKKKGKKAAARPVIVVNDIYHYPELKEKKVSRQVRAYRPALVKKSGLIKIQARPGY